MFFGNIESCLLVIPLVTEGVGGMAWPQRWNLGMGIVTQCMNYFFLVESLSTKVVKLDERPCLVNVLLLFVIEVATSQPNGRFRYDWMCEWSISLYMFNGMYLQLFIEWKMTTIFLQRYLGCIKDCMYVHELVFFFQVSLVNIHFRCFFSWTSISLHHVFHSLQLMSTIKH